MDTKILGVTLVILAAIFAGLNGDAFSNQDISTTEVSETNSNGIISKIPILNKILEKPEPKNPIKTEIKLQKNSIVPFKNAEILLTRQETLNTSETQITSPTTIKLKNTTGKITFKNTTNIQAESRKIETNQVTIKQTTKINSEIKERIEIQNTEKISLKYKNASIKPQENTEFGIETENSRIKINSFKGNMTIEPKTRTLILNGKVDKLQAGQYALQTN